MVDLPVFLRFAWALEGTDDSYIEVKSINAFGAEVKYALRVDLHWRQLGGS